MTAPLRFMRGLVEKHGLLRELVIRALRLVMRLDRSRRFERAVLRRLLRREALAPERLERLALLAENAGDPAQALAIWRRIAAVEPPGDDAFSTSRIRIEALSRQDDRSHGPPDAGYHRARLKYLAGLVVAVLKGGAWDRQATRLTARLPGRHWMIRSGWRPARRLGLAVVLARAARDLPGWPADLAAWWAGFDRRPGTARDRALHGATRASRHRARLMLQAGRTDAAEAILSPALTRAPHQPRAGAADATSPAGASTEALRFDLAATTGLMAEIEAHRRDWRAATRLWQAVVAMTQPPAAATAGPRALVIQSSIPRGPDDDPDGEDGERDHADRAATGREADAASALATEDEAEARGPRWHLFARRQLRRARARLALQLAAQGRRREAAELVARLVESAHDQRVFAQQRETVEALRDHLTAALSRDGVVPPRAGPPRDPPRCIVICVDVLKLSDLHAHARVVLAMARNLAAAGPDMRVHVVVTHERLSVSTPIISSEFHIGAFGRLREVAVELAGALLDVQVFLHICARPGIEGVIAACRRIIELGPDVILYGGGTGRFSNDSLLVRHTLFQWFPAAYFYLGSNNEVDERLDMIIARGPHAILGTPGQARVRIQAYPTFADPEMPEHRIDPAKFEGRRIVSALAGKRMEDRMRGLRPEVFDTMFRILDEVPGAVWLFIGAPDPDGLVAAIPQLQRRVRAGQVQVLPILPLAEFERLVGDAALFLQMPDFIGGAATARIARNAGVPVLTFRHSDVSGRQPPETVFPETDIAGCADMAVRLLGRQQEWARIVRAQFDLTLSLRETAAQGFMDCLGETVRLALPRLAAPAPAGDRPGPHPPHSRDSAEPVGRADP